MSGPGSSNRFEVYGELLLDMAQERRLERLLDLIVRRMHEIPPVALARIWLLAPGDICSTCYLRNDCPDRSSCLHLVASAGSSQDGVHQWSGLDGRFRRFPVGVRKVGHIAATGQSVEIEKIHKKSRWIARPEWAARESIRGFSGHPLVHKGETLGVLAAFTRGDAAADFGWLRLIADHAASAIANARAFGEIERLRTHLQRENEYLRDEVRTAQGSDEIVGRSPALINVLKQVDLVAPTLSTVLILGETGTGKELISRAIHERSRRAEGPLIKVNCASIPSNLFESEFFGHIKGAFTGAVRDRVGRFELADGGTLFLDEVAEIPIEMQSKLLRVLQEQTFERVGEEKTRSADVRVVAATNRDLRTEVERGRFRQDLFFRLSVFPITVPPLRERIGDLPLLVRSFLGRFSRRLGVPRPDLRQEDLSILENYHWPGNVRELGNVVERAIISSRGGPLRFELPDLLASTRASEPQSAAGIGRLLSDREVREMEKANLLAVLERTNWKISGPGGAAEFLGLHPATLSSRLKTLDIERSLRPRRKRI